MRALGYLFVAAAMTGRAAADPQISSTGKVSERTIEALRIQMSDIRTDVSIHLERVSATELVVTVNNENGVVVHAIEIPNANEADANSAIALKVADLIERMPATARSVAPRLAPPPEVPRVAIERGVEPAFERAMDAPLALSQQRGRGYVAELGLDSFVGVGETGFHATAGMRWQRESVAIETVASVRVGPEIEQSAPNGEIRVDDIGAMLGARIFTMHATVAVGAHGDVGVRRLDVTAVAMDGRTGGTTTYVVAAAPGVDVRWKMTQRLEARASVSALLTFDRPVFSLDGMATRDVGAPAMVTTMALVFVSP